MAGLLLAGCSAPAATNPTSTATETVFTCSGHPTQGSSGTVAELGVDTSPAAAGREVVYAHMEVRHPGRLNLTANWTAARGTVDLLLQEPGRPDQTFGTSPFNLTLVEPAPGNYSLTLRAHPLAYQVSFAVRLRYDYAYVAKSADCPLGI